MIGGGCEGNSGDGGECNGKISITGGAVTISSEEACAIGHGKNGDDNGTLTIDNNMSVTAGSSANGSDATTRIASQRVTACRESYAKVEVCTHENCTYSVLINHEEGHIWLCENCRGTGRTEHTWSNGKCEVCGYESQAETFTITLREGDGTGTQTVNAIAHAPYTLPECEFSREGQRFEGWENGGTLYQPDDEVVIDKDTEFTAQWVTVWPVNIVLTPASLNETYPDIVRATPDEAAPGETVSLKVIEDNSQTSPRFSGFSVVDQNNRAVSFSAENRTFVMPEGSATVTASFTLPYTVTLPDSVPGGTVSAEIDKGFENDTITITAKPASGWQFYSLSYTPAGGTTAITIPVQTDGEGMYTGSFRMPGANATVSAEFLPLVPYIDENGEEREAFTKAMTADSTTLTTGWYMVSQDLSFGSRIIVDGDVHLILCDGKTLTARRGVIVSSFIAEPPFFLESRPA